MAKSPIVGLGDQLQLALRPLLGEHGFRSKGRSYRRVTPDGLTHIVHLQLGPHEPPAWTPVPGLRENLYGAVTINLGVYIPEVQRLLQPSEPKTIQEYHCAIRARLGTLSDGRDLWWELNQLAVVVPAIQRRLLSHGLPWLDSYATRDQVLTALEVTKEKSVGGPPLVICAMIRLARGDRYRAHELLAMQYRASDHQGHREYLEDLARRLTLPALRSN